MMSHLSGECRRKVFLNQFGEDKEDNDEKTFAPNSIQLHSLTGGKNYIVLPTDATDTIGFKGELKIAQWI